MPPRARENMLAVLRDMGTYPVPPRSPSWGKNVIKTYNQGYVYILDHSVNYLEHGDRSVKQQQHDERCMQVANFFDSRTPYEVQCVAAPRGTTIADWKKYWDLELADKTEEDLIIIYFHGKAYGTNQEYKWQLQKGLLVNAHQFISKINRGSTDCIFLLDCFFHTRMSFRLKWKLDNAAMMDFIFSPYQLHTGGGTVIDHEGDWSKAFVRNMNRLIEGEGQMPSWTAPVKSIPTIMSKDHTIYQNQGSGFKLQRRGKDRRRVLRHVVDPVMVWSTGQIQFFGLEIRGPEEEPEDEDPPESESELEDEGVDEDFDAAAQFANDHLGREADIADGFGGADNSSDGNEDDESRVEGGEEAQENGDMVF